MEFQQEGLNALFEHTTEAIIIVNSSGKIVSCNPASSKMFKYTIEQISTLSIEDLIPGHLKDKHKNYRSNYNANPRSRPMGKDLDLRAMRSDGSEFPAQISLSYFHRDGELFVIAFMSDITERKAVEEQVKKLNQELEAKVNERTKILREALNELEDSKKQLSNSLEREMQINEMKSRFVSMASHEFRTPLSAILSSASLISKYEKNEDNEKRLKHINRIKSSVTNLTLILNDFLSVGKLEEGKVFVNNTYFKIKELQNECVSEMGIIKKENQIINSLIDGKDVDVYLDKQMVKNIYLNLISNAIKFSGDNKEIDVITKIFPDEILISVKDYGVGIPAEEQEHMFERFYRARNVTNIQGTGLGLSIVYKYIELMKGKIKFISELNKGTEFIITLPNKKTNEDYFIN
ncbi:MAG: PAS domain S-box protein [Bacteroidetes bacterium]|nr:PAS domain S-box protein [Bacteroidota bacterium]